MIHYTTGNLLESTAQAIVNTVNTVGVMGKGLALQFKQAYPSNFKAYALACKRGEVTVGRMFVYTDLVHDKIIINFPTKQHWRAASQYAYIEEGLVDLSRVIREYDIQSIAIPALGAGNGGLDWSRVKAMIHAHLAHLDIDLFVYEPIAHIQPITPKPTPRLTPARALLLYVLYDLVKHGEYVSEFSSEKVCYFLQRFGAVPYFKLKYTPYFYGPYSGKVRFVLHALNGTYLKGFHDMSQKPFDPLMLNPHTYEAIQHYIHSDEQLCSIAQNTTQFLQGFYSDFALELLSTIDYIAQTHQTHNPQIIKQELAAWSGRKKSLFTQEKHLKTALTQLQKIPL